MEQEKGELYIFVSVQYIGPKHLTIICASPRYPNHKKHNATMANSKLSFSTITISAVNASHITRNIERAPFRNALRLSQVVFIVSLINFFSPIGFCSVLA